jgi:hypothetical protein
MKTDKLHTPEMFNEKKDISAEEEMLAEEKYFNDILRERVDRLQDCINDSKDEIKSAKERIKRNSLELAISERLLDPLFNDLVKSDERIEKIESIIEGK